MCELRPYVGELITWVTKDYKNEITKESFLAKFENSKTPEQANNLWDRGNQDLWTVLFHKTTGTARIKLRVAQDKAEDDKQSQSHVHSLCVMLNSYTAGKPASTIGCASSSAAKHGRCEQQIQSRH